jgi:hypothetical protein
MDSSQLAEDAEKLGIKPDEEGSYVFPEDLNEWPPSFVNLFLQNLSELYELNPERTTTLLNAFK